MNKAPRNQGEEGEIYLKAFLLEQMHKNLEVPPFGRLHSVGFGPDITIPDWNEEYSNLLSERNYNELKKVFPKSPASFKADIEINGENYSLKSKIGARSALVNHTSRKGFLRIYKELNIDIDPLDRIIDEYWTKREAGIIMEDISNSNVNSPFRSHKDELSEILKYFLFTGTGSSDSKFTADYVLEFSDPTDPETYTILDKDSVIDHVWDNLVFSLRSKKGMPDNYDPDEHADLAPWVRYRPDSPFPKGALHIRS